MTGENTHTTPPSYNNFKSTTIGPHRDNHSYSQGSIASKQSNPYNLSQHQHRPSESEPKGSLPAPDMKEESQTTIPELHERHSMKVCYQYVVLPWAWNHASATLVK
jgi:hypothetical protein